MPKRKSNPIDWAKHADWHEAEGTKRRPPKRGEMFFSLATVTQKATRKDIVQKLCNELRQEGLTPTLRTKNGEAFYTCELTSIEQQRYFIQKAKPHYLGKATKDWAEEYLKVMEERKPRRPRKPFIPQ